MNIGNVDPFSLAIFFALLGMIPLIVVTTTSFLKISLVLLVLRNALGVQQVPPTLAIYGIALSLTSFVMAPTLQSIGKELTSVASAYNRPDKQTQAPVLEQIRKAAEPLAVFMARFAKEDQIESVLDSARRLWPPEYAKEASKKDFLILMPAFVISELQTGYEMAFLIFIPMVVIDLLIANLLMALGMQQVSPQTLSIPMKILLFVSVDGWGRLLNALAISYQP